ASQSVTEGGQASFTVVAQGTQLTYQWRRSGVDIPGATSPTYTTPVVSLADDGAQFTVTVSNSAGSVTSQPATLSVNAAPPVITLHPTDVTVLEGEPASFTCAASGSNVSYT